MAVLRVRAEDNQSWLGIGAQGDQGPQGYQGHQGTTGAQGPTGVQGAQGNQGYQGPQGYQGVQGANAVWRGAWVVSTPYKGNANDSFDCVEGASGNALGTSYVCILDHTSTVDDEPGVGANWATYWDILALRGYQGVQGPQGSQGIGGDQGPQGATGAQGLQGAQGVTGSQGDQGVTGAQGAQGGIGPQGYQGNQGSTGGTGDTGPEGTQGPQGEIGAQGPTGAQGSQGTIGAQGSTGPQGNQGAEGAQGTTGPQGSQGAQGAQGLLGDALAHAVTIDAGGYFKIGTGTKDVDLDGIQIDNTEIVGQENGVDQVAIGTDGKLRAGAGAVILDVDGITITSGAGDNNTIKFTDSGINAWIFHNVPELGPVHTLTLGGAGTADYTSPQIIVGAEGYTGYNSAIVQISAERSTIPENVTIIGYVGLPEISADPSIVPSLSAFLWLSDGTESGDAGELMFESATEATVKAISRVWTWGEWSSTSWDGDAKGTGNNGVIDLSAVFGLPAGIKAVSLRMTMKDNNTSAYVSISKDSGTNYGVICRAIVANAYFEAHGIVECDANGDVYFTTNTDVDDVRIYINGYYA